MAHAYAQLVAEGWFEAHRGRGTSVARDLPVAALTTEPDTDEPLPRYDLRPGVPDVAGFPRDAWTAAYRRALLSAPAESLAYGDPLGHPRLRAALAAYLGRARGVRTNAGQIVICNGVTHGLSMLAAALSQTRRACVAMESHCFPIYRRVAVRQGLTVTALPLTGPEPARTCWGRRLPPRAVLTPAHQFPTGVPLTRRGGRSVPRVGPGPPTALVIEDDYDGEFRYDHAPDRSAPGGRSGARGLPRLAEQEPWHPVCGSAGWPCHAGGWIRCCTAAGQ